MVNTKTCFEKAKSEEITWLSQILLENKYTLSEIVQLFQVKFRASRTKFTVEDLREFAKENLASWTERESPGLAEVIAEQTEGVEESKDLLEPEDQKKINPVSKHRRILLENWKNYQSLLDAESTNETAKNKYLETISKEIDKIAELEAKEKSILSMLEEVKKAEEAETPDQFRDYLEGYCIPKLATKTKDLAKIKEHLAKVKERSELFVKIMETPLNSQGLMPTIEEGVRQYLKQIYTVPV